MSVSTPRATLSSILGRATPDIVVLIAQEAARSAGASVAERQVYQAFLSEAAAPILAAVALDDPVREQTLEAALPKLMLERARVVPPLARVGLLEIGLRLARIEVAREASTEDERVILERELAALGDQLRAAVALMCGSVAA